MAKGKGYQKIEQQLKESGKRVKAFCEDRGITPNQYYYLRKKQSKEKESKFEQLIPVSNGPDSGIRILYPNGVQLELYGEISISQIRRLLDARI